MRSDFQKLLCECYKTGRGGAMTSKHVRKKIKNAKNDEDGSYYSTKVSRRKIIGWEHKEFGENLAPLKRFVGKQVGKKWDKVYSEICKHNKKASAVGVHIFQHLYDFIIVKCEKHEDGSIHDCDLSYRWRTTELSFGEIYVDPEDGIIKKYKRNKRKVREPREPTSYELTPCEKLEKVKGIWYLIEFGYVEEPYVSWRYEDGERFHFIAHRKVWRQVSKKQLNSKELKQHGLSNAA